MWTIIDYVGERNGGMIHKANPIRVGYLEIPPEQALRELFPKFYIVDYLGIDIPSKNKYNNKNHGLRISPLEEGIGLGGTIEMLEQSERFKEKTKLFNSCKHEPFSKKQKKEIIKEMISSLRPSPWSSQPLFKPDAEKYVLIFDMLGYFISIEELTKLSAPDPEPDFRPNGGIIRPEDCG